MKRDFTILFSLKLLILLCSTFYCIFGKDISLGCQCTFKHAASGLFLAASISQCSVTDPENSGEFLFQANAYLAPEQWFDALWTIKKEHCDKERWNFQDPALLKNNSIIRLESFATGGNLCTQVTGDGKVIIKTGFKFNFGKGCSNHSSNLRLQIVKIGPEEVKEDSQVVDQQLVFIKLTCEGKDDQLLFVDKDKQIFFTKAQKDCKIDELVNARWLLNAVHPDYFTKEYRKPLDAQSQKFDKDSKFKLLDSNNAVQTSAIFPKGFKDGTFLYSLVRQPDQEGFICMYTPEANKINKFVLRMTQICMQNASTAWGVGNNMKLVKIMIDPDQSPQEAALDQKAHQVGCSADKVFVRIDGDIFELKDHDAEHGKATLNDKPLIKDALFFCSCDDATIFFIDSQYAIYKQAYGKAPEKIFQYKQSIYPPFCKLAVGAEGKVLLATTTDGRLFIFRDKVQAFVFTGIEFCVSASVCKGRVVFVQENSATLGGPCYTVPLDLLTKVGNQGLFDKAHCHKIPDLVQACQYFFSLSFKDVGHTEELILWLDKKVEDFHKDRNTQEAKDFQSYFTSSFAPAASLLALGSPAKRALERIGNYFAETIVTEGDVKGNLKKLQQENQHLKDSLQKAGQIIKSSAAALSAATSAATTQ